MKTLSILICTIDGREEMLQRAFYSLCPILYNPKNLKDSFSINYKWFVEDSGKKSTVEILIEKDNKQMSVGKKRQMLLDKAKGDFIVFFDDDDLPLPGYIDKILKAINHESEPDCIGINGVMTTNGANPQKWIHSLRYKKWENNKDGWDYVRPIIHFNPVRRDLALAAGFKDERYAEDHSYSLRLQPLLKKEHCIPEPLFHYQYSTKIPHSIKYGIK